MDINTRLFEAIKALPENKDHDEIEALLQANADIDARDEEGNTPIMWAALRADSITFNKLITLGANIQVKNNSNATLLILAAAAGHLEAVHLLVSAGLDIHHIDNFEGSAVWYAKFNNQTQVLNYFLGIMSNEEVQAMKDKIYVTGKSMLKNATDYIHFPQKYLEKVQVIEDFKTELNTQRKKLCTLLFSNKEGLLPFAATQYPLMPTLNATLLPELMKKIVDLKFLCMANQFPKWYELSCLKPDIKFFLNWEPVPPKSYSEMASEALETAQKSFLSAFANIRNYIAPSETLKRKRDDNEDAGPDNKKPRL